MLPNRRMLSATFKLLTAAGRFHYIHIYMNVNKKSNYFSLFILTDHFLYNKFNLKNERGPNGPLSLK